MSYTTVGVSIASEFNFWLQISSLTLPASADTNHIDNINVGLALRMLHTNTYILTVGLWSDLLGGIHRWQDALLSNGPHVPPQEAREWTETGETFQRCLLRKDVSSLRSLLSNHSISHPHVFHITFYNLPCRQAKDTQY